MGTFRIYDSAQVGFDMRVPGWGLSDADSFVESQSYPTPNVGILHVANNTVINTVTIAHEDIDGQAEIGAVYGSYDVWDENGPVSYQQIFSITGITHLVDYSTFNDSTWLNGITAGDDRFYGNNYADWILAGSGDDFVFGGGGDDSLTGDTGSDTLYGQNGDDALWGGRTGLDTLVGGVGDDVLGGGTENDFLRGDSGYDVFVFDTRASSTNIDKIYDLNTSFDTIALDNAVYTKVGKDGNLASAAFWKSTTGKAHDRSDRIIYETDTGKLFYDADGSGSGKAVQFATLNKGLALSYSDFMVL